jgi:hypothetical protein
MQTWDYPGRFLEFTRWLHAAPLSGAIILNDVHYIEWNANKMYLLDLQADGICIPRTVALDCSEVACRTSPFGNGAGEPGDMTGQIAVIKPQIGCSAVGVNKFIIGEESILLGPVLLQEFVPSISHGELSLIFFDGVFSHCVRKMPKAGDWRTNWRFGGRSQAERNPPRAALVMLFCVFLFQRCCFLMLLQLLAQKSLEAAARHAFPPPAPTPPPPVWARVDCVMRGDEAVLMELELIEPVLFLDTDSGT